MTTDDRFGHNLSAWLREDGEHRVPEHLAEVLVQTVATRQRPWWSSPERWLPVDTAFRPRFFNFPRPGRLLLVAGLILVLIALAIAAIGSRPRVPEPFGLARNGVFVESRDGDIFAIDPVSSSTTLLVGGAPFDFGGYFSRDGSRFVFLRSDGPVTDPAILAMYVANADGSGVRALTPPTESLDWLDWSPDGTRIAYMADRKVYVVDVDGGEPRRLVGTGPAHFPTWLPPDGKDLIYRLETASPGIWAIASDGTGKRRLLSKTPPNNEFDYQSIAVAPDGAHITFTRWSSDAVSRVFRTGGRDRRGDRVPDPRRHQPARHRDLFARRLVGRLRPDLPRGRVPDRRRGRGRHRQRADLRAEAAGSEGWQRPRRVLGVHSGRHGVGRSLRHGRRRDHPVDAARRITSHGPRFRRVRVRGRPAAGAIAQILRPVVYPGRPAAPRPAARIQSGHGPPSHPDPRRRHRSGAGGGDPPRPRRHRRRVRVGGRGRRRGRHGRVRDAAPGARPRVDPAQQGRAQGPDHDAGRGGLPERQRDAPPGARPVRQPAPGALDARASRPATRTSTS